MMYELAVCDSEREYACQLADYFSNKKGFPLQVQIFSSLETLAQYSEKKSLSMALISEKDFDEKKDLSNIENIFLLGEKERNDRKVFYKYQSTEKLTKELLSFISEKEIISNHLLLFIIT